MEQPELKLIAAQLEGLEETIINKLIDRAQFKQNEPAYVVGQSGFKGETDASLFDLRLRYQEEVDALFGRFQVPEERPFNPRLPRARRKTEIKTCLRLDDFNLVNLTPSIRAFYLKSLSLFCQAGEDGQFGSSVEHDVFALQAISRRVHFGAMYVAESKFLSDPATYRNAINQKDRTRLLGLLTRPEVEEKILKRVSTKVEHAQALINPKIRHFLDPSIVLTLYRDHIIPLTKEGELTYLFNRV